VSVGSWDVCILVGGGRGAFPVGGGAACAWSPGGACVWRVVVFCVAGVFWLVACGTQGCRRVGGGWGGRQVAWIGGSGLCGSACRPLGFLCGLRGWDVSCGVLSPGWVWMCLYARVASAVGFYCGQGLVAIVLALSCSVVCGSGPFCWVRGCCGGNRSVCGGLGGGRCCCPGPVRLGVGWGVGYVACGFSLVCGGGAAGFGSGMGRWRLAGSWGVVAVVGRARVVAPGLLWGVVRPGAAGVVGSRACAERGAAVRVSWLLGWVSGWLSG